MNDTTHIAVPTPAHNPTSFMDDSRKANPRRGEKLHSEALAFADDYPIGSSLSTADWDAWLVAHGLLGPLNPLAEKDSDEYMARAYRRNQIRYNLNKSASHPRLSDTGKPAYNLVSHADGSGRTHLTVVSVYNAYVKNDTTKKVASLIVTKKRQLEYLLQSTDWKSLPVYEQILAQDLEAQIGNFAQLITNQADFLSGRFQTLQNRIEQAVASGQVKPSNGGITGLLSQETYESD